MQKQCASRSGPATRRLRVRSRAETAGAAAAARAARRRTRGRCSARRCTTPEQRAGLPDAAAAASLGCGNPTAVADLREGETVLDLGSGGGIDVLLSARRVGPTGVVYGLDMTEEMLALAQRNKAEAGDHERPLPARRDRGRAASGRVGRRRDLELRHQPLDRQGARAGRDRPRPQARRPGRGQRRRRRGPPLARGAGRARRLGRLHRRRPVGRRSTSPGSRRRPRRRRGDVHPRGCRRLARGDRAGASSRSRSDGSCRSSARLRPQRAAEPLRLYGVRGRRGPMCELSFWRKKPPASTSAPTAMNEKARATELRVLKS